MLISKRTKILSTIIGYSSISVIVILIASLVTRSFTLSTTGEFTLSNFRFLFTQISKPGLKLNPIWPYLINSLYFALTASTVDLIVSMMAAYALSRLEFKGKKLIINTLFLLYSFPAISLLVSIFYVLNFLGIINTLFGAILVKISLGIPIGTCLLKGFFDDISWDLEWASYIDGCTKFGCFRKILIPRIFPGIFSVFTLALIGNWSEFIILVSFVYNPKLYPISLYLRTAMGDPSMGNQSINVVSAVAIIYILPVVIYFVGAQIILLHHNVRIRSGKGV